MTKQAGKLLISGAAIVLTTLVTVAVAVHAADHAHSDRAQPSHIKTADEYRGQQDRAIKALSADEVAGYLQGKGLGLAKAAELNQYPGPSHVLALASELELTETQKDQTRKIFNEMQSTASELGYLLVESEGELDKLFANKSIDEQSLSSLVVQIGELDASIRYAHLRAHLQQRAVLSTQQIHRYNQLRGYPVPGGGVHSH